MAKTSLAKKILAGIGGMFALFFLISPLIPFFTAKTEQGYYYCNMINYYGYLPETKSILYIVVICASALVGGFAILFFVRCLLAKPMTDDKEDKNFVFGYTFLTLCSALLGAICFSMGSYIPTFIAVGVAILGVLAIVLHFKVLSDI